MGGVEKEHKVNGWNLKCFELFLDRYLALIEQVEQLERDDPEGFVHHPATRLLFSVDKAIRESVPGNPAAPQFQCAMLGNGGKWRRVKQGLPQRYRLFFQFHTPDHTIIYVWLNDEGTLRKAGAKSDVYAVFEAMTRRGQIPSSYEALKTNCVELPKQGTED